MIDKERLIKIANSFLIESQSDYEHDLCMESRLEIASKILKTFLKERHKLEIKK